MQLQLAPAMQRTAILPDLQNSSQTVPGTGEGIAKSGRKRRICCSHVKKTENPYFSIELAFGFVTCGRITSSRQVLYSDGVCCQVNEKTTILSGNKAVSTWECGCYL